MRAVRVKSGTLAAFIIVCGAVALAAVALLVRPPPPSKRGPATAPTTAVGAIHRAGVLPVEAGGPAAVDPDAARQT